MWSAAMDVAGWLRSLRLEQYEEKFRDNKIDADVLPQLTADDLRDIGVAAVGDRRRLLAAIAALAGAVPSANVPSSGPLPRSAPCCAFVRARAMRGHATALQRRAEAFSCRDRSRMRLPVRPSQSRS